MNVDLSKLTPAPWEADGFANSEDMWDIGHPCMDLKGRDDFRVLGIELTKADAEFIALARNAFDIQMRRGWYAVRLFFAETNPCPWRVRMEDACDLPLAFYDCDHHGKFADPFTALVEADKWYRENVEGDREPLQTRGE